MDTHQWKEIDDGSRLCEICSAEQHRDWNNTNLSERSYVGDWWYSIYFVDMFGFISDDDYIDYQRMDDCNLMLAKRILEE